MLKGSYPKEKTLYTIVKRIRKAVKGFSSIAYLHVLCDLIKNVGLCANEGCKLRLGDLKINGLMRPSPIP